jgi:hypothetical protein
MNNCFGFLTDSGQGSLIFVIGIYGAASSSTTVADADSMGVNVLDLILLLWWVWSILTKSGSDIGYVEKMNRPRSELLVPLDVLERTD